MKIKVHKSHRYEKQKVRLKIRLLCLCRVLIGFRKLDLRLENVVPTEKYNENFNNIESMHFRDAVHCLVLPFLIWYLYWWRVCWSPQKCIWWLMIHMTMTDIVNVQKLLGKSNIYVLTMSTCTEMCWGSLVVTNPQRISRQFLSALYSVLASFRSLFWI